MQQNELLLPWSLDENLIVPSTQFRLYHNLQAVMPLCGGMALPARTFVRPQEPRL